MLKTIRKMNISKHFLISAVFIVLLFAGFGISMDDTYAIDVNQSTVEIASELNIEDKFVNSQENTDSMNGNGETQLGAVENDDVLAADILSVNNGYFSDIKTKVNAAHSGDTIKLSGTIKAKSASDTIVLDKQLHFTSSSGAILDAKELCQIFNIRSGAAGSTFNNIIFRNGASDTIAGALYVRTNNVKVTNCVFENNVANDGAAIYTSANSSATRNFRLENCKFYNNHATHSAGAISVFGNNSIIKNCIFDSNFVKSAVDNNYVYGGAAQVGLAETVSIVTLDNCIFENNQVISMLSGSHGGAGCIRDGVTYKNCRFINNSAHTGGALTYHGSGTIKNCTFIDNTAFGIGGALYTGLLDQLTIQNCSFQNNKAEYGGAAYLNGNTVEVYNCDFDSNHASINGGAINVNTNIGNIHDVTFENNTANVDGGAIYIKGLDTTIKSSSFISNSAIPDVNKLDDGLGGAIYVNSTSAKVENNKFYYNTARNGSAVYYDKFGENLELANNTMYQNQAWVYLLPVYAEDIYYGDSEKITSIIHGGNNIARYGDLAVSNAVYNAAKNEYIEIDGETPQDGATSNGHLYQDDREYNMDILLTVNHEDGTVVYNKTLNSNVFGEVNDNLNNLKAGKYYVTARHMEDNYYKAITNTTTFTVTPKIDEKVRKSINRDDDINYQDVVIWTLNITNNGPSNATNVIVYDVLPEGLIWVDDNTNGKYDPKTGILTIDFLEVGEVFIVKIWTTVNKTGPIENDVNVTADEYDYNMTNNHDKADIDVNPSCDLAVEKSANQSILDYGNKVKWTVKVTNNGPDIAHNVVVSDILPKSLIFISSTGNYNNVTGEWIIGTLNKGVTVYLDIICKINGTGVIENDVSVSGSEHDVNPSNNYGRSVINVNPSSDLAIVKVVNATAVDLGDVVKWTITVTNNGPDAASGVNISDVLPAAFSYLTSSKPYSNGVINIGDLAVGTSVSVDILSRAVATGTFVNVAGVEGNEYDWDLSNNRDNVSLKVNPAADLAIDEKVNNSNPNYNDTVKWTITVTNLGPDIAHDVVVSDVLPKSLIFITSNGNYNNDTGKWDVGTLIKNQKVTLEIITRVNATGFIGNDVSVKGREFDINMTNNYDREVIDVDLSSDLAIVKVVNASAVDLGDVVKWTITVTNNGPDAASGVNISDVLPDAFSYLSSTKAYDNGVIRIGDLAAGASVSVDILSRAVATGTFVNVAGVEGNEYDWDLSNNRDNASLKVYPAADLSVEKKVNNSNPNYNDVIEWIITVSNNGPDIAHDVVVTDILSESLIFITSNGNYNNDTGKWDVGTLIKNQKVTLEIITRVNATGFIGNDVSVKGREFDINMTNNHDGEVIDVNSSSDLAIVKVVNASAVDLGDVVKWTITVINNGPDAASGVNISDVLPDAFSYLSSTKAYDNGVIRIGDLAAGASVSVDILSRAVATGTFVNVAGVEGNEYDWDLSNNRDNVSLKVNPAADLIVDKKVNNSNPNYNDTVKWTITVTNNGPDVAHNVVVTDILPESLIFITSNGNYNNDTGKWDVGTLIKNQKVTLEIITRVNATGLFINNVSVLGDEFDINKTNNANNQSINVSNASDLSVVKFVNSSTENYLNLIKWTVIAHNNGPDNATGVIVDEILPEGLFVVNYTASKGFYDDGKWLICCMESGSTQTLELICKINKTGTLTNIVEISGNEYDPDSSNNLYNESVSVPLSSDLAIIKNVNNSNPNYGDVIEWTITVINNGPDDTTDVLVVDILPIGLKFISYESTYGSYYEGYWEMDNLKNGENQTLTIKCQVESLDDIENIAMVIPSQYDWNESNNRDSEYIALNPVADLEITKLVNTSRANYLDLIKWTLVVKNKGPNNATGVYVIDDIPDGLDIIEVVGNGDYKYGIWEIGMLENGKTVSLDIICKVKATGDFINVANVWADETDLNLNNNEDESYLYVPPASDLSITKTVTKSRYYVGSLVNYSIKLSNGGPNVAENVKVREVMDEGLEVVSFHASAGDFDKVNDIWSLDSLDVGQSTFLKIKAIAKKAGELTNKVSTICDNFDPNLKNNNDTVTVNASKNIPKKVDKPNKQPRAKYKVFSDSVLLKNKSGNPIMVIVLLFVFTMGAFYGNNFLKKR